MSFRLVLSNPTLPEITDGYEIQLHHSLGHDLKLSSGTSEIPVILVTSQGDIEGRIAGFEAGAADCVSSMIDSRELGARVNTQLASSRSRKQILGHEQQLRTALASMSQGVCLFNGDGTLALSNSRYAEVYGVDPALIHPGQSLEDIIKLRVYSRKGISSEPSGHELDHCGLDEGEACG
ncbi:hypothetical protein F4V91_30355 [Neorhizobium galegae]|uniref:Response regulatory domain-containing protein n=1 Tax=Neorhizobium galegae TaxID=399 RepID=A0A6A1TK92_NEOGA|nr:PAS-domain containing protein [Neorhizobium galegae]KAB1083760.1 hypothetical protein F4V91_30355 [Neorhizobium galegae]